MSGRSPARLSLGQRVLFSALTTTLLLGLVEGAARLLLPPAPASVEVGPFTGVAPFVPDPADPAYLVTQPGLTDAFGGWDILRPQRFPVHKRPGDLRVLLVGGSSVFQLEENVPALRQALAVSLGVAAERVEVVNGGGNGQGSAGVRHVVTSMLDKELDAVVVYSAHNEYTQHLVRAADPDTWAASVLRRSSALRAVQQAVDAARLRELRSAREASERRVQVDGAPPVVTGHRAVVLEVLGEDGRQSAPPDEVARRYADNLAAIVADAHAAGVAVVLTTVPSNLLAPAWVQTPPEVIARFEALRGAGNLAEAAALADETLARGPHLQSTHVENNIVRELARSTGTPLADVQAAVSAASPHGVPGETMFMDHCHLDPSGRQVWIDTVVPVLAHALEPR